MRQATKPLAVLLLAVATAAGAHGSIARWDASTAREFLLGTFDELINRQPPMSSGAHLH